MDLIIKGFGALAAVLAASIALYNYWRSVKTKRAEWLVSLHEKFFESDRYAAVRRVLDYRLQPDYAELAAAVTAGTHHPLADELYRYLNFFELLAELRELGQISDDEIQTMFEYDVASLRDHDFIMSVLRPQGFELLSELMRSLPSMARH